MPRDPVGVPKPLVLLGAGGHGKVLLGLIRALDYDIKGVCDPQLAAAGHSHWFDVPVLGGDEVLDSLDVTAVGLVNGIGQVVGSSRRRDVFVKLLAKGFRFPVLVHPFAWVAPDVELAEGVQVMAGAILQPGVRVGANSVINTRASVDHDCMIENDVHVAPGAVLCGGVSVAAGAFVGAGSTTIQGLSLGEAAVVGAGVTVVRGLLAGHVVIGSPVRVRTSTTIHRQSEK